MSKRSSVILLEDIGLALAKIARYVAGMDRQAFMASEITIDAVVRNLEVIGEAVKQLPDEFKAQHSSLPWAQMAGLRNRIVHDYAGLDLEIIWEIVLRSLPELREQLVAIRNI